MWGKLFLSFLYFFTIQNDFRLKCVSKRDEKKAVEPVDIGESLQNINKLLASIDLKVSLPLFDIYNIYLTC